jgi:hypothetical protein
MAELHIVETSTPVEPPSAEVLSELVEDARITFECTAEDLRGVSAALTRANKNVNAIIRIIEDAIKDLDGRING